MFVETDVTDEAAVQACVAQAVARFGRLDILVCCAGVLGWEKPFFEQPVAQFDKVMQYQCVRGLSFPPGCNSPDARRGLGALCDDYFGCAKWQSESGAVFGVKGSGIFIYRRAGQCVLQTGCVCQWRGAGAGVDGDGGAEIFARVYCQSPRAGDGAVFGSGGGGRGD